MSVALLNSIILRTLSDPNYSAKGDELTWEELDTNLKIIADAIKEVAGADVGGIEPYNPATEYSNIIPDYVTHDGNTYEYINAIPQTGVTPGTDPTAWLLVSAGLFSHLQNTDIILAAGTSDEVSAAAIKVLMALVGDASQYEYIANKGLANGYASLDGSGLVPAAQLPSYVDDVLEYATLAAFPVTGSTGKIYIDISTNNQYRWSGSVYVSITSASAVWGSISGSLASQTDLITALNAKEANANKATSFSVLNNILYPTTQAVDTFLSAFWTAAKAATQTIAGVWTFSVSPIVPNTPSGLTAAVNSNFTDGKYLDQTGSKTYVSLSGTNTYTGTASPAISAYASGNKWLVKIPNTSSASSTLNFNSVGAKKIFKKPTVQAGSGDLLANYFYWVAYDSALDSGTGGYIIVGWQDTVFSITLTTSVSITTATNDADGLGQNGKNVIIDNGANAINYTINDPMTTSFMKHGSAAITFVQGSGRTMIQVDGTAVLNGAVGSSATIVSKGTTDYLRISNA